MIKRITSKLNDLVRSWKNSNIISEQLYKRLNCSNGNLPRCYGLPKIHKPGYPLRIIVSTLGSPLYNVARLLHDTLRDSIGRPRTYIRDGWSFVKITNECYIQYDELMVSLDVTALFTNIPKDLVLKGIEKRWNDISKSTTLSLPQFLYAIELILDSTSFSFKDKLMNKFLAALWAYMLSVIPHFSGHCNGRS